MKTAPREAQVRMETGAYTAALAVKSARVDVVPGYPITPQTSIMEAIAAMVDSGELHAVHSGGSEHSVLSCGSGRIRCRGPVSLAHLSQRPALYARGLHMASGALRL